MMHESVAMLFRHNPHLVTELIGDRMPMPEHPRVQTDSADLGDIAPIEYRADTVVTVADADADTDDDDAEQAGALTRAVEVLVLVCG